MRKASTSTKMKTETSFTDNNYETAESSSPYYIMHARRCLSDGYGREQLLHNEEKGISVVRYDQLLNEYVRSNSFSALQKMNMEYRQPTKILIEEVLGLGQVSDDTISQKLKTFYSDTTLLRLMADVETRFPNLDEVEKGLTKGFKKLKKRFLR